MKNVNKYKLIELECLGIEPRLYFIISRYICNKYKISYNDNSGLRMIPETSSFSLSGDKIIIDVIKMFGIDSDEVVNIMNEFSREIIIKLKMQENIEKYWDYALIPMLYEENKK